MIPWLALPALVPLGITLVNLATWRRPWPAAAVPTVSALVPARDEEANIEACVQALRAQPALTEILVYDDGSTDHTGQILARLAAEEPRLRVLHGDGLPSGWVGKPHACHRLALQARGERLLFVDADVRLLPGAVERLLGDDVVTALPRQVVGTFGEGLVLPLLHLTYLSWLPLELIRLMSDPRVLAANGQVLSISRAAYDAIGGFQSVRAEVVDDMALCRRAKSQGLRVAFVDGFDLATCRMYGGLAEAVDGFSKNLYEGLGHPVLFAFVLGLYALCFLGPWMLAALDPLGAAIGVAANLLQRALLALRWRLPASSVILHPVTIVLFLWIAVRSWSWSRSNRIRWRGREYAAKGAR